MDPGTSGDKSGQQYPEPKITSGKQTDIKLSAINNVKTFLTNLNENQKKNLATNLKNLFVHKLFNRGWLWDLDITQITWFNTDNESYRRKQVTRFVKLLLHEHGRIYKDNDGQVRISIAAQQPEQKSPGQKLTEEEFKSYLNDHNLLSYDPDETSKMDDLIGVISSTSRVLKDEIKSYQSSVRFNSYDFICAAAIIVAVVAVLMPHCALALLLISIGITGLQLLGSSLAAAGGYKAIQYMWSGKQLTSVTTEFVEQSMDGNRDSTSKELVKQFWKDMSEKIIEPEKMESWLGKIGKWVGKVTERKVEKNEKYKEE